MKFLINRGPNCDEANVKATRVTEKTVPATPIIAAEIVDKILRAESALFTKKYLLIPSLEISIFWSKITKATERNKAIPIIKTGTNQKVAVSFL